MSKRESFMVRYISCLSIITFPLYFIVAVGLFVLFLLKNYQYNINDSKLPTNHNDKYSFIMGNVTLDINGSKPPTNHNDNDNFIIIWNALLGIFFLLTSCIVVAFPAMFINLYKSLKKTLTSYVTLAPL